MVDMFYVDRASGSDGLSLFIHYNNLKNADKANDKIKIESAFTVINKVCSETGRSISELNDIFLPMDKVSSTIGPDGIPNTDRVVKVEIYSEETGVQGLYTPDSTNMPGRLTIGDISSDGFPDIIVTIKNYNNTS